MWTLVQMWHLHNVAVWNKDGVYIVLKDILTLTLLGGIVLTCDVCPELCIINGCKVLQLWARGMVQQSGFAVWKTEHLLRLWRLWFVNWLSVSKGNNYEVECGINPSFILKNLYRFYYNTIYNYVLCLIYV